MRAQPIRFLVQAKSAKNALAKHTNLPLFFRVRAVRSNIVGLQSAGNEQTAGNEKRKQPRITTSTTLHTTQ